MNVYVIIESTFTPVYDSDIGYTENKSVYGIYTVRETAEKVVADKRAGRYSLWSPTYEIETHKVEGVTQ